MARNNPLPHSFYARPTLTVAPDLLGRVLVRHYRGKRLAGRIVEIEAYLGPEDPASHARHGPASRAAPMFGPPGFAYVYFTYGMYHCMNAVTEAEGSGTGVLVRAIEPLEGIGTMQRHRGNVPVARLTDGPGKLCQALAIDLSLNRTDLTGEALWIERGKPVPSSKVDTSPRIGIRHGREHHVRFYAQGSPFVSAHPRYERS
ncbi:MAG: DNA-3-methyladenine glycosylase [bacterium]|nr:DNA-3-methyladenine glycosylase [bacterium]